MQACAMGDRKAYAQLYTTYLPEALRYVYLFTKNWEDSEELVQELFVSIWEKRTFLSTVGSFRAYLFGMAKHRVIDFSRHQKVQERYRDSLCDRSSAFCENQGDYALLYNQYQATAQEAIALLPEKRREVFSLRMEGELSLDEISEKLSISKSVVKKQLYAANQFVREYLRKHADIATDLILLTYFLFH
ncbi:RNA polymerase sigma factor [Dyadobacter tibetensis]|uniref:RNA polymerase sigma factor n=1 Tax=Dyadobacter tibetensis TaxID=1211851 RepID=UPI0004716F2E|nr:sigma-70 family RNA polymerase sigma factor [Dyadobacter tibetensis]